MWGSARSGLFKGLVTALCIVSIIWIALTYFIPAPPSKVVMATAFKGASFEYYGQQYRDIFARFNVKLELRETAGGVENVALLQDPKSDVQIAFVQAGVSDGKHTPGILSLGTVYNQPYWIFYSATEPLDRLSQLKGKRIAVGPQGSGTRLAAEKILGKGGVNSETATLLPFAGLAAVNALSDKKVDAVWIIGSPDATAVKSFLGNPDVRLLGFPMAEAYTRIYPELVRLVLPKGVVDIDQTIPADDVQLIGTTTKVLVRSDLNPEIVELLLQTMTETHSRQEIFQRSGEFPNATDAEYPVAATAIDYYKNGPSYLRRHVPLWLSVHVQRAIAVLVAGVAIGLPLFHYLPLLYKWKMRRRLLHWYSQLKALEASFDASPSDKHLLEKQIEIERIEDAVSRIRFPLTFTDQLYNLRSHIDIVRRKITSRANARGRMAAE
jgi:TRAP transporter TAXI family solute receptor